MKIAVIITTLLVSAVTVFADGRITGEFNGQLVAAGSGRILLLDKTGKVLWQHTGGNCSDIWMLENGNVLHADNNVAEINPKTDETVWSYRPEMQESGGTFSCQRLKNGNTLVGENSSGRLVEVDKAGKVVFELKLPLCKPGDHDNLRMVRKLDNGNYLVCHKKDKLVREYTPDGKVVFEVTVPPASYSAVRLPGGNTVVGHLDAITEFDSKGGKVWEFLKEDLPDLKIGSICGIHVLKDGVVVMGVYQADESGQGGSMLAISRDKKLLWRLVNGDKNMMSMQVLDETGKPLPGPLLH